MPIISLTTCKEHIGKTVTIQGWIQCIRLHKKIGFCDIRNSDGTVQVVVTDTLLEKLGSISVESVVSVTGTVRERDAKTQNTKKTLGSIEVVADTIEVLSLSSVIPFPLDVDTRTVQEDIRLRYRYLDLRSNRMHNTMAKRHEAILFLRNFLSADRFLEIETPLLTKGTPEGAREFVVPSRLDNGLFFVLPQSPQQYKQLLMVSGIERYFQFARCFRDEDKRQDRQPEFTQLDIEMAFTDEEMVMRLVEQAMVQLIETCFPHKKIQQKTSFPHITYQMAMEKYKTDKPDLRKNAGDDTELAFCWITGFPLFKETDSGIASMHHPFTAPSIHTDIATLSSSPITIASRAYDLVLNGCEIGGGSIRIHHADIQRMVFAIIGISQEVIEKQFGHLLTAFSYGVPPHGGIAIGIDRLLAILQNETSIREVIAFPKTGEAKDLAVGAPSAIDSAILRTLGIKKLYNGGI